MQTARELFIHELADMLDAEKRLVNAIRQHEQESSNADLKRAFAKHREETENEVQRIQQIYQQLGIQPEQTECKGIVGLIEEHRSIMQNNPSPDLVDIINATTAVKVERYEMSAYETLMNLARELDLDQAHRLLKENYKEEEDACNKMQSFVKKLKPGVVTKAA